MRHINIDEFNETINSGITLVDFFADWCGPCKMLSPVLESIEGEFPTVQFVKVNVDENMEIADRYSIMSIPALFIFKDGELVNKAVGYMNKDQCENFIRKVLN